MRGDRSSWTDRARHEDNYRAYRFHHDIPKPPTRPSAGFGQRHYAPFTTRTPCHVTILIVVLGCIGALEVAFRTGLSPDSEEIQRLVRRQEDIDTDTFVLAESTTTSTSTDPFTTTTSSSADSDSTNDPEPDDEDGEGGLTMQTSTPEATHLTTTTPPVPVIAPPSEIDTTPPQYPTAGYVEIKTKDETTIQTSTDEETPVISITPPSSEGTTSSTHDDYSIGGYIEIATKDESTTKESTSDIGTHTKSFEEAPANSFLTITSASTNRTAFLTIISDELSILTVTQDSTPEPVTEDGTTITPSPTRIVSVVTVAVPEITITSTNDAGIAIIVTTKTTVTQSPATQSATTQSATTTHGSIATVKASQLQIGTTFTEQDYFTSSYLSVILAVCLKLTWGLVFSGLKLMEPFYQLTKDGGASAEESLLADYLSAAYSWSHVKHIFGGHWVMLFSTIVYIAVAALSPIAAESMSVIGTEFCPASDGTLGPCEPVWLINLPVARGLEGVLCLVAVAIVLVMAFNWRRKSGVFSNPSSIASMAALLSHEDMLTDLRQLDQHASDKSIAAALSDFRYTLLSYETAPGTGQYRYGIARTTSSFNSAYALASSHNFDQASRAKYRSLHNPSATSFENYSPVREQKSFNVTWRLTRDVLFLVGLMAFFSVVLAYRLVTDDSGFNNFFNSGTFGPKFILTAAAAVVDFQWKTLEREVRILGPYQNLHKRMADAHHSVLVDVGGVPISTIWGSIARGELFHALTAFTAILSDCLIVAIPGVPFSSGTVREAYLLSSCVSMVILGIMMLLMVAIIVWRIRSTKLKMPREPNTILAVWLMLCDEGNEVRKEYSGWESTRGGERDRAARGRGAKYWGGWAKTDDGAERWRVGVEGEQGRVVGYG